NGKGSYDLSPRCSVGPFWLHLNVGGDVAPCWQSPLPASDCHSSSGRPCGRATLPPMGIMLVGAALVGGRRSILKWLPASALGGRRPLLLAVAPIGALAAASRPYTRLGRKRLPLQVT
ncbi:hypothetical protein BHE74_00031425, partial [Ensete ventricosum]